MTRQVNFDSFDLATRKEINTSIEFAHKSRGKKMLVSECPICGDYVQALKFHIKFCKSDREKD